MADLFLNKKADLANTDLTPLYEVPTNTGNTVFSLFKAKDISAKTTVELLTNPLILNENEEIKVQAENAGDLHVILSAMEIS